jgi:hypothetical protein
MTLRPFRTATSAARFQPALLHVARTRSSVTITAPPGMKPVSLAIAVREAALYYKANPEECPEVAESHGKFRVEVTPTGAEVHWWDRSARRYSHAVGFTPLAVAA